MTHLIISISQPPYLSAEGFWQPQSSCLRSWATGTFCSSQHLHNDKVWRWASPQNRFIFSLCHLPAWTLYVLLRLRRSSHLKWSIYKTLFTNPTRKSSMFFQTDIWHSLWFCQLLLLCSCFYVTIHFWNSCMDKPLFYQEGLFTLSLSASLPHTQSSSVSSIIMPAELKLSASPPAQS